MTNTHKEPNYMAVFYLLGGLTITEIAVIYLPLAKLIVGILLVSLALTKASLVALYFMHLKFEKRPLALIALTPLLICTILIFALLPDLTGTSHRTSVENTKQSESASH